MVGKPTLRSRKGRVALPGVENGWEALPEVREWSRGPPKGPGVVRKALPDVRQWSGGPLGGPGVDERLSRIFRSDWEEDPDFWE